MQGKQFPNNYLQALLSPKRIFAQRGSFKWRQSFFLYLFLSALLLIPLTFQTAENASVQLADYLPGIEALMTDEAAWQAAQLEVRDGQLVSDTTAIFFENEAGIIGVNLTADQLAGQRYSIDFSRDHWQLISQAKGSEQTLTMAYTASFDGQLPTTGSRLQVFLDQAFSESKGGLIVVMSVLVVACLLVLLNVILIIGSSFFLWLTKKSQFSDVRSFHESLNIILQSLGAGTVLAFLAGCFSADIMVMAGIQSLGLVVMLFAIYLQTRFRDAHQLLKAADLR